MNKANQQPRSTFSILLAVDGSENSVDAARLVRSLPLSPGSRVAIVGVLSPGRSPYEAPLRDGMEKAQQIIAEGGIETSSCLLHGHTAKALVEYADDYQPDLITVGATGLHTTLKVLLGGVAQQVVEYARWPVLVVRAPFQGIRRVLLAADGSPYTRLSAEYLAQFPLPQGAEVNVMHVLPPLPDLERIQSYLGYHSRHSLHIPPPAALQIDEQKKQAEELQARALINDTRAILEKAGLETKSVILRGDPANEILDYSQKKKMDLVVAGSRGLSAIKGWWWGSVSRKLVHHAACSTLFVRGRPEERET